MAESDFIHFDEEVVEGHLLVDEEDYETQG